MCNYCKNCDRFAPASVFLRPAQQQTNEFQIRSSFANHELSLSRKQSILIQFYNWSISVWWLSSCCWLVGGVTPRSMFDVKNCLAKVNNVHCLVWMHDTKLLTRTSMTKCWNWKLPMFPEATIVKLNSAVLQKSPKVWATFERKFAAKTFRK